MIPPDKIEEIKNAHDIVDIVSEHLTLKRAGRNFKANCPFHQEKTPSFIVSPEKQIYHCFGCGKGGNVFSFIQEMENVPFIESVKMLAQRAGIAIDYDEPGVKAGEKEKILEINREALKFFRESFRSSPKAAEYVKKRGISPEAAEEFRLGFAPENNTLFKYLKSKGFREEYMVKSFLVSRKGNELVDIFKRRIIFPIFNTYGDPIAFGGRVIDDSLPKYINSSETPLYVKGRNLYNLNNARRYREEEIVIVEGYTDAISLYMQGFKNVVASLGTAFTPGQAKLFKRFAQRAVIVYDMDEAGRKGAERAGEILFSESVETRVADYSGAKDPDEFIEKFGAESLKEKISSAASYVDFRIDRAKKGGDINNGYYKEKVIKELTAVIEKTDNLIVKNDSVKKMIEKLDVPHEVLKGYMKGQAGAVKDVEEKFGHEKFLKSRGIDLAERTLLRTALEAFGKDDEAVILRHLVNKREETGVLYSDFRNDIFGELLEKIESHHKKEEREILKKIEMDYIQNSGVNSVLSELLAEIMERKDSSADIVQVIDDCFNRIRKEKAKVKVAELNGKIADAEKSGDSEELNRLLSEKQELQKILKQRGEDFE